MSSAERKAAVRLLPFLFVLYIVSFLDRVNFGYASLAMNANLGIDPATYGLLSGIFFIPYVLLEIPSNIALSKFGARRWIARIMLSWGIVAVLSGFATQVWHLATARILLGAAEAGFFPGIVFYLSRWFGDSVRARTIAFFMLALPLSNVVGAPVSGLILDHINWFGLESWRWIFILEGLPAVLLAYATYKFLPDSPAEVSWLNDEEKAQMEKTAKPLSKPGGGLLSKGFSKAFSWRLCALGAVYFSINMTLFGINFWLPHVIKGLHAKLSDFSVGLLAATPYALAAACMLLWSARSDAKGERHWHTGAALLLSASGLAAFFIVPADSQWLAMLAFAMACVGLFASFGPFWPIPSTELASCGPTVSASGIAFVNAIGNCGSFFGPAVVGWIAQSTCAARGLAFLSLIPLGGALAIIVIKALISRSDIGNMAKDADDPEERAQET